MNRWVLILIAVLLGGLYFAGIGLSVSRGSGDPGDPEEERAPDWIETGLGDLLLPFAEQYDLGQIEDQEGSGWRYDSSEATLRIARTQADDGPTTVALRLPAVAGGDSESYGAATLAVVASVNAPKGGVEARQRLPDEEEEPDFQVPEGDLRLAIPGNGMTLEIRSEGPRVLRFEQ